MSETSKRVFGSEMSFLDALNLGAVENSSGREARPKERKSRSKELTKEEKVEVVYRLIDYFQTH